MVDPQIGAAREWGGLPQLGSRASFGTHRIRHVDPGVAPTGVPMNLPTPGGMNVGRAGGFTLVALALIHSTRLLLEVLGTIDFVVTRVQDPGWLATIAIALVVEPPWPVVASMMIAGAWLLLRSAPRQANANARRTDPPPSTPPPAADEAPRVHVSAVGVKFGRQRDGEGAWVELLVQVINAHPFLIEFDQTVGHGDLEGYVVRIEMDDTVVSAGAPGRFVLLVRLPGELGTDFLSSMEMGEAQRFHLRDLTLKYTITETGETRELAMWPGVEVRHGLHCVKVGEGWAHLHA